MGSNNINYLVPQGEWGWAALEGAWRCTRSRQAGRQEEQVKPCLGLQPSWPCSPFLHAPARNPAGQFGTRLQGGKDAASPRYIFTRLAPLTRHLFNEHDDRLLAYLTEEGQSIEPEW